MLHNGSAQKHSANAKISIEQWARQAKPKQTDVGDAVWNVLTKFCAVPITFEPEKYLRIATKSQAWKSTKFEVTFHKPNVSNERTALAD